MAAIFRSLESKGDYHSFQFYRRINPNFMEDQKSTFQCSNSKGICFRSRVIKKYAHNEEFFSSDSISPLLHTTRPSTTRSSIFLSKRKSWSRFVRERERERERKKERGCSWSGYEECFKSWKAQKPLHGSKAQQNVTTGRTSDSLPRGRKVSPWSTLVCAIVCRPRDLRG